MESEIFEKNSCCLQCYRACDLSLTRRKRLKYYANHVSFYFRFFFSLRVNNRDCVRAILQEIFFFAAAVADFVFFYLRFVIFHFVRSIRFIRSKFVYCDLIQHRRR